VRLLFYSKNNKAGETVVPSVCAGVLQGKHPYVAEEMSWRCFLLSLTQVIPCNSEERKKRIPSCKTTGETWA